MTALSTAKQVIDTQLQALKALQEYLDDNFEQLIDKLLNIKGRVIVSGMGKSGHIARKISASLASTGTISYFVHPAEASHGDLGMINKDDIVILLSNSGETKELNDIINYCSRFDIYMVGVVRRKDSTLAKAANISFILPDISEASGVGAPSTSTTMMLVWGDCVMEALCKLNGFNKEDFKNLHPSGAIGKALSKVKDLMRHDKKRLPICDINEPMSDVIIKMTQFQLGCICVCQAGKLIGLITDGDLRRHLGEINSNMTAKTAMTASPITVKQDILASKALLIMQQQDINILPVTDNDNNLQGIISIHHLLDNGVI